jgi:hypothetical protein
MGLTKQQCGRLKLTGMDVIRPFMLGNGRYRSQQGL